jgi:hypothetical protein
MKDKQDVPGTHSNKSKQAIVESGLKLLNVCATVTSTYLIIICYPDVQRLTENTGFTGYTVFLGRIYSG